jgi:hypothetical protein
MVTGIPESLTVEAADQAIQNLLNQYSDNHVLKVQTVGDYREIENATE